MSSLQNTSGLFSVRPVSGGVVVCFCFLFLFFFLLFFCFFVCVSCPFSFVLFLFCRFACLGLLFPDMLLEFLVLHIHTAQFFYPRVAEVIHELAGVQSQVA